MTTSELKERQDIATDDKLSKLYNQFRELLIELRKQKISPKITTIINESVELVNSSSLTGDALRKLIKQKQTEILKQVEKEHKIVPKNYYRNLWMLFGISAFGLPIGVAFGLSIGNIGLLGVGLPIGMGIGIVVGTGMDKKALKEERQLDIEIKY
ncbi:hypothetical protein [Flavobacterium sp. 25HG05S-40]|uniref:hypothetical protein n=1 Tax=Flavobacterium sp. 25HG05S-40 TaxID=3458682 RepID=UPI0040441EAF